MWQNTRACSLAQSWHTQRSAWPVLSINCVEKVEQCEKLQDAIWDAKTPGRRHNVSNGSMKRIQTQLFFFF